MKVFCGLAGEVVINEIMYHPKGTNVLEEYIELYNPDRAAIDVSGWRITSGIDFTFPANTSIPASGYLVVAANAEAFQRAHPGITNFVAGWTGRLSDDGENIVLKNAGGTVINEVAYAPDGDWAVRRLGAPDLYGRAGWEWLADHDGQGKSLELVNPGLSNRCGQNWTSSSVDGGTPGRPNSKLATNTAPLFLEVGHFPPVPTSTSSVWIRARVLDESPGLPSVTLHYRVDGTSAFSSATMLDDGQHQDGLSGDGLYGATIRPYANGTIIEFYVTASDAEGNSRTYPAVLPSGSERTANLLYQVSDEGVSGNRPLYRLIMSRAEYDYLKGIWSSSPHSDASVSGTFIATDAIQRGGVTTQTRYSASFRNRGHGTRTAVPHNVRVTLPKDKPWNDRWSLNLNTSYTLAQVIGSALSRRVGIPMPESRTARVRVNGADLASPGLPQLGVYAANETVNSEFIKRQFPGNSDGNLYRGVRDTTSGSRADFAWHGPSFGSYTNAYIKESNVTMNDYSDLIALVDALNNAPEAGYVEAVKAVANVEQWMRYFALNTFLGNQETALPAGAGDDYILYRGVADPRFQLLPYDMDSILGRGTRTTTYADGIFRMMGQGNDTIAALVRFMKRPEFAPIYYRELYEMANSVFIPAKLNPLLDQLKGFFGSGPELEAAIENMKAFNNSQCSYVLSQIPLNLTVSNNLAIANGYPRTSSASVALSGRANAITSREIRVNGIPANYTAWQGAWTAASVPLQPGINRVRVQALDENGMETERVFTDIWYDKAARAVGGNVSGQTAWTAASGPYHITSTLTVANGATFMIEPGTTVYLGAGVDLIVANGGRLLAEGSATSPVIFTRHPGSASAWGGIVINGAVGSPETRITHAHIQFNGSTAIHSKGGTVLLDHLTFGTTDKQYVSLDGSSFVVSNCTFPAATSGFEMLHGSGGIKTGGRGIFVRNFFGAARGVYDVLDFSGGNRPGPVLHFIDNVCMGSDDDILDLDGTDAWIEGNIFLHIHRNSPTESASAISAGQDAGNTSEITIIGNIFFDCDQAATARELNFFTLLNNTIVRQTRRGGTDTISGVISLSNDGTGEGKGFHVEGNIIVDAEALARNLVAATVTFTNNLMPFTWRGRGGGNSPADPLLKYIPALAETQFRSWEEAQIMRDWFSLRPESPARGAGPGGRDIGATVPLGISVSGAPSGTTASSAAVITVGAGRNEAFPGWPSGWGYTHYKWRLDSGPWSDETPVDLPITLTGLARGPHQVEVIGKRDSGLYQDNPDFGPNASILASATWVVDPDYAPPGSASPLRINEVLARNMATFTSGGTAPDLIELFNDSSEPVSLAGISITDNARQPAKFSFPAGATIPPQGYLTLICDNETSLPGWHIGFAVKQEGDALFLYASTNNSYVLLDSVTFGAQIADLSIGRLRDGSWGLAVPTFGTNNVAKGAGDPSHLRINEWLASAELLFADDFLELYNPLNEPVGLGGLFLSDAAGTPDRYRIPELSFIGPKSAISFVADGDDSGAALHLNFKLSSDAGLLLLSDPALKVIDVVNYGPQRTDVSQGRGPNAAETIIDFRKPTPGAPNPETPAGDITVTRIVTPLIGWDQSWKYNSDGVDLGSVWSGVAFNDTAWPSGMGLFGVEAGTPYPYPRPIQTGLPLSKGAARIKTFYFRTHFTISNTNGVELWATNLLDDGAVFYVNGHRAGALRVSDDPAVYSSNASNQPDEGQPELAVLSAANLAVGDNVLAVEVHQSGNNSSDVVFGMTLSAVQSITNRAGPVAMPVVLNEILVVNESRTNASGGLAAWIELYNPSTNAVALAGLSLTDNVATSRKWVFPPESRISSRGFLSLQCDPSAPASATNTGFRLSPNGGAIYLFNRLESGGGELDALFYGLQTADHAVGRHPDGADAWQLTLPTEGRANELAALGAPTALRLNEWMADPASGEDWFEIFNGDSLPVPLDGLALTDDLNDLSKSPVRPLSFIGSGMHGFVRFWADKKMGLGADHADFKLSKEGSDLGLATISGILLDGQRFGQQAPGVSQGRLPDGSGPIVLFENSPTPGLPNSLVASGDTDGDGMPDAWELANGFNPLNAADALADADGDGLSNYQEYLAGTDPRNQASSLVLTGVASHGQLVLSFNGLVGRQYIVEFKEDIADAAWQTLSVMQPRQNGVLTVNEDQVGSARFYRLRITAPVAE